MFGFLTAGNGWVAWRNDSFPNHFVEMIFEFDQIRNFSSLHIFTNNFFTKNVQVRLRIKSVKLNKDWLTEVI
jgi:discoidin domain receptor family protein 2